MKKGKSGHFSIAKNAYLFCNIMYRFAYTIKLIYLSLLIIFRRLNIKCIFEVLFDFNRFDFP